MFRSGEQIQHEKLSLRLVLSTSTRVCACASCKHVVFRVRVFVCLERYMGMIERRGRVKDGVIDRVLDRVIDMIE